jgi:hypothetical protein
VLQSGSVATLRPVHASCRFKSERIAIHASLPGEPGETPRTVSAHAPVGTVGIVVAHAEMRAPGFRSFEREQTICSDPESPSAYGDGYLRKLRFPEVVEAVVDNDEVVTRATHFRKFHNELSIHAEVPLL